MKQALATFLRGLRVVLDALWALGGFAVCTAWWVGWWLKDQYPSLIWLYFIPPLAVALFGFIWLFLTLRDRFRFLQLYVFLTVLSCFVKVLVVDHRWNRAPAVLPEDNIRILHWNTAWGVLGVESIVRHMVEDNPDIVLISEPPRLEMISDIAYHALGMEHIFTDAGMTLASHFPITYLGNIIIPAGAGWHVRVDTDVGPLEFAAVDIVSRPNLNRIPVIRALARWVRGRTNDLPLVVMGDFNTPHDSVALVPLRSELTYAYHAAGRGWPYTWPVPLPVFAIDQTWVSPDVTVVDFFFKQARFSDHKRQIADIVFPNRSSAPERPSGEPTMP
ncbi:MAG TPA: endonuclease/exonuclease/phosphatase family protein [Kiritimatiellia bacterium]|nr:endonuclease/exonuclease/phosphatase family protein [Kiritimatiellia bacterium]HMO97738.1 endonuclease/exonuclease/phosphatase family protein [Kiritimatiellia bacterium]HMP95377.1 endonuclease/exonuclease/phosphatase family protein [Kiritimatiellia bacterium]